MLVDLAGVRIELTVLETRLNFSTPARSLNAGDLVLAARYINLCRNAATDCSDSDMFDALDLTRNLSGGYDLDRLMNQELVVPDLTGDGAGNIADLLILHRFLSGIPLNLLLIEIPAADRSILEEIILRAVDAP